MQISKVLLQPARIAKRNGDNCWALLEENDFLAPGELPGTANNSQVKVEVSFYAFLKNV